MRGVVELEATDLHHLAGLATGAPQEHAAARFELAEIERLAEVIVRADVQCLHAVFDPVTCGQHQHRGAVTALAHAGQHAQPIQFGQADIEHDQIERLVAQHARRGQSVALPIHGMPTAAHAADDRVGQVRVVFHQQDAHRSGSGKVHEC
ncbi:hypothetical protein D3C71_1541880 [compost metagenome]